VTIEKLLPAIGQQVIIETYVIGQWLNPRRATVIQALPDGSYELQIERGESYQLTKDDVLFTAGKKKRFLYEMRAEPRYTINSKDKDVLDACEAADEKALRAVIDGHHVNGPSLEKIARAELARRGRL
jgi:hypothetical protein